MRNIPAALHPPTRQAHFTNVTPAAEPLGPASAAKPVGPALAAKPVGPASAGKRPVPATRYQCSPPIGVGARLPAKRPVHPTHICSPYPSLRGQARSYTQICGRSLLPCDTRRLLAKAGPTTAGVSPAGSSCAYLLVGPASAGKRPVRATRYQCSPPIGVGARLPAKRPVHPTHRCSPCPSLRGQARSYTQICGRSLPSRDIRRLLAEAGPTTVSVSPAGLSYAGSIVGPASAGKRPVPATRYQCSPPIGVGARLPAKRPVHPTHRCSPCPSLRGQARSYTLRCDIRRFPG